MRLFLSNNLLFPYFSDFSLLLLDVSIKITFMLSFCAIMLKLLRTRSAALRHLVLLLALSSALALPILSIVMPAWQLQILPRLDQIPMVTQVSTCCRKDEGPASDIAPAFEYQVSTEPDRPGSLFTKLRLSWLATIFWLAGFILLASRLMLGALNVSRIRRSAHVADQKWASLARETARQLGVRQSVVLLESSEVTLPLACGFFRPAILLPLTTESWSKGCRETVLRHEFAHLKRRDCQSQILAQAICSMYWFNPLVWWAAKRMRLEREFACDNLVLHCGTRATDYAHHLLEVVKALRFNKRASLASVSLACSQLEGRLRAMLDPDINRRLLTVRSVVLGSLVMGCCVLFAAAIGLRSDAPFRGEVATRLETDRTLTKNPSFSATNSEIEPPRIRKSALKRMRIIAAGRRSGSQHLMVAPTQATSDRVTTKAISETTFANPVMAARTLETSSGVTVITRSEVTVTQGSQSSSGKGLGFGLGQGFGRGPD